MFQVNTKDTRMTFIDIAFSVNVEQIQQIKHVILVFYFITLRMFFTCKVGFKVIVIKNHIWGKVFNNGPSKICERQPLKNLKGRSYHFKFCKGCLSQSLLGPFFNTLPHKYFLQSTCKFLKKRTVWNLFYRYCQGILGIFWRKLCHFRLWLTK